MNLGRPSKKILFILKERNIFYSSEPTPSQVGLSSGLLNSVRFVIDLLTKNKIQAKMVVVKDGNGIDKEIFDYKPTHVIIEAIWVTPEKLKELQKKYSNIMWFVRLHSEIPFIANEGIALEWIYSYLKIPGINLASNSERMRTDLTNLLRRKVYYQPNYYPVNSINKNPEFEREANVDIGCFGSIRPLKNQFAQAVAAIEFSRKEGKTLFFHINGNRIEQRGETVLKNIRALFANNTKAYLVEHDWLPHDEFVKVIRETIDIGMQVSFTETFNIVSADFVNNGIPVVVSPEVQWASSLYKASPTCIEDMADHLRFAYKFRRLGIQKLNKNGLIRYAKDAKEVWLDLFGK